MPEVGNQQSTRSREFTSRQRNLSWLMSTAVHLMLIVLVACWALPPAPESTPRIEAHWLAEVRDEDLTLHQTAVEVPLQIETPLRTAGGSLGGEFLAEPTMNHTASASEPAVPQLVPSMLATAALNAVVPGVAAVRSGEAGDGNGRGAGIGVGDGDGDGFFGSSIQAQSVVFVVDCSSSMNHPHDSEAKTRFRRLKFELLKAVGTMGPTQQFFIIYFNDRVVPMPAVGLQYATPEAQQHYLRWMAKVPAVGETDPREALQMALRLNPQVIYFLTDGAFEYRVDQELQQFRQRSTQIHTFVLGSREGEAVMKAVAANNRGEFKFVP